jgi:putative oxidoreductase
VVAASLAVIMVGAIVTVHLAAGFFLPNGIEFALALLGVTVALVLTGAGRYSVDGWIANRRRLG